jgi:hypothetical protein
VSFSSRHWLAAVVGLSFSCPWPMPAAERPTGEPSGLGMRAAWSAADNQKVADAIAARLGESGQLRHYTVDIAFRDGAAQVSGSVADQSQREEVLRLVQGVPGVERVVDRLNVSGAILRVQAGVAPGRLQPVPSGEIPVPSPSAPVPPVPAPPAAPGAPAAPPPGVPVTPPPEAVPSFQAPAPSYYSLNPPRVPPYSWPTYAPYNNYSRVAYPEAYPYNAWPFIGPIYPFPKVPLGWRAVKLEWDDGYWWFSKVATKHDWWRLRYY